MLQPCIMDCYLMLIYNILPLRGGLDTLGAVADGAFGQCGDWEDVTRFYQPCPHSFDLWEISVIR